MERIQALIDKLYQQKQQNAHPAQLLITTQLLQSELLKLQEKNGSFNTSKVAVTLPAHMNTIIAEEVPVEQAAVAIHAEPSYLNVEQKEVDLPKPGVVPSYQPVEEPKEYAIRKPLFMQEEPVQQEQPLPSYTPSYTQVLNPAFETHTEAPTLTQHQPGGNKELNELMAERKASLNDLLKQDRTELAHSLKDTPIKDLKKAIGINDRFTFVNELFRGDEAMYERSIKTINGFRIFSEAEYWMARELKFKLGWDDDKETVQHFYHLVRRRFA